MPHPNEALVRKIYETFGRGDLPGVLAMCDETITFTVAGSVPFAGTYNKQTFPNLVGQIMGISAGTFGEALVDVVANDEHAVAILDHWLDRDGKRIEYRTDHIWGIKDGRFTSWLERPGSQAEFDKLWS
jgi:ketosteroid isomerase-like protein